MLKGAFVAVGVTRAGTVVENWEGERVAREAC